MNLKSLLLKGGVVAGSLGLLGGGAAVLATSASAATAAPAIVMSHRTPMPDQLKLTFQGTTYTYNVQLRTQWVGNGTFLVRGHLTDTYEPQTISLPVSGVIFGNGDVVLSLQYPTSGPDAGPQGLRTFSGHIGPGGVVTGVWDETGSEAGSGQFTLDRV